MKKYLKETIKYILRSYPVIRRYVKEIDKFYDLPPKELWQRNEQMFLKVFREAYDHSPFYHSLYKNAGIKKENIRSIADLSRLPVITKEMVKEHGKELLTSPHWELIKNHTSGTTGTPLEVYEDWPAIWREQAYLYCYRKRCGFTYGQPLVSLRGNLEKNETYMKVHISNTLYLSSYNINQNTIVTYYQQIVKHKPVAIEGYPSSLYALALLLRDNNMQLHIPLAFTSSESLLDYQRELIQSQMDTVIYDMFGTTERTIQLCESINHNGYYEAPGYSINEYTEDGEITTSLINFSFPLIRYQGNDIMELINLPGENKQVRVKSIQGRKSTYLEGLDGTKYSGALLTRVFKDITTIDNAQFIQKQKGEVVLNVVEGDRFTEKDAEKLKAAVFEQLGANNFTIRINSIKADEIIYTSHNKFNYVLNLTNNNEGNS